MVRTPAPTFSVLSSEHERSDRPSLEKFTHLTVPVWALSTVDLPSLQVGKGEELVPTCVAGAG